MHDRIIPSPEEVHGPQLSSFTLAYGLNHMLREGKNGNMNAIFIGSKSVTAEETIRAIREGLLYNKILFTTTVSELLTGYAEWWDVRRNLINAYNIDPSGAFYWLVTGYEHAQRDTTQEQVIQNKIRNVVQGGLPPFVQLIVHSRQAPPSHLLDLNMPWGNGPFKGSESVWDIETKVMFNQVYLLMTQGREDWRGQRQPLLVYPPDAYRNSYCHIQEWRE